MKRKKKSSDKRERYEVKEIKEVHEERKVKNDRVRYRDSVSVRERERKSGKITDEVREKEEKKAETDKSRMVKYLEGKEMLGMKIV